VFYRVVQEDLGPEHLFEPCGFYEKVGEDGEVLVAWFGEYATFWCGDVLEVCFGSSPAGCLLSIAEDLEPGRYWVYGTEEEPDVDLRGSLYADFRVVGEVRYRRPVLARRLGVVELTPGLVRRLKAIRRASLRGCGDVFFDSDLAARHLARLAGRLAVRDAIGVS